MAIEKEWLGRGWGFPFLFDPATGGVAISKYEENIRQNITIIIGTRPGERQMLPKFGCKIHDVLFSPNTRRTAKLAARHVRQALTRWEKRIEVLDVQSSPDPSGAIQIEVSYKITSTGAVERLIQTVAGPGR